MVSIEDAQGIILSQVHPLPTEEVQLLKSLGRVLAADAVSPMNLPQTDNSAMDGYAFGHATLDRETLRVSGFLPAGAKWSHPVPAGEAIRIMTGAPLPHGCDTVVPIEETEERDDFIRLTTPVSPGANVRPQGEDMRLGEIAVPAGSVLRPQEIGMLAALGMTTVRVFRRTSVAILATGDELVPCGETPAPGMIVNSNSYSIAAQVIDAGGDPTVLGIVRDEPAALREMIRAGIQADLLITTGGVSVGDRDLVREIVEELGGIVMFWKVAMKPGKPVAFALVNGTPVFALPGNPAAAMVTFEEFVRPALLRMMGHRHIFRPHLQAVLTAKTQNRGNRPHLARGRVELHDGAYRVTCADNQSSGCLSALVRGNCLVRMPPDSKFVSGDPVEVQLLDRTFEMGKLYGSSY